MKEYQPLKLRPLTNDELAKEREGFMARRRARSEDVLRRVRIREENDGYHRTWPKNRQQRGER